MRYDPAWTGTFGPIIRHSLEDILFDRSRSPAYINEKIDRCPGRPAIDTAETDPTLVNVGIERFDDLVLVQSANYVRACASSVTHIQFPGDTIPISGNSIG